MKTENRWLLLAIISMIALLVFLFNVKLVRAQEHEHQSLHGRFYQTWNMPDNRAVSCCHNEDCKPAEVRFEKGRWLARQVGDTNFTPIPPHKIEHDRDSPDGRSHLCGRKSLGEFTVFCFIAGSGT